MGQIYKKVLHKKHTQNKFLSENELVYFIKLVCDSFHRQNVEELSRHEKSLVSWYLREYCFLPFSAITKHMNWAKSANCRESIVRVHKKSIQVGIWPSVNPDNRDVIHVLSQIAAEHFEMGHICLADCVLIEDQEHLLWWASKISGYTDIRSSHGCKATPKYSQLQLIEEMLESASLLFAEEQVYLISENYFIQPQ